MKNFDIQNIDKRKQNFRFIFHFILEPSLESQVDYPVKSIYSPLTPVEIKQGQEKDPYISVMLEQKRSTTAFSADKKIIFSVPSRRMLNEWKWLSLIDGILYRSTGKVGHTLLAKISPI